MTFSSATLGRLAALGVILSALSSAVVAEGQQASGRNVYDREQTRLARAVSRQGSRPEGLLPLLELWRNWDRATPEHTLGLLERLERDRRLGPARRVRARALLARGRMRIGEGAPVTEALDELGYVRRFRVVGPFDNEGKSGFDKRLGPEEATAVVSDEVTYEGPERPVRWRVYPNNVRYGYVSLDAVLRPTDHVCAFAESYVHADEARPLSLWLGAAGAIKAYWNGEEVHRDAAYRQHASRDRSVAMVGAHAGVNRLLLKVCVDEGRWGFYARIGDERGGTARGVRLEARAGSEAVLPQGHSAPPPTGPRSVLDALEQRVENRADDARALENLARYLYLTGSDDPAERRAKQLAARAATSRPTVRRLQLAARLAEERGEVMKFSAHAHALAPRDPDVVVLRARVMMGGPVAQDVLPLIDTLRPGTTQWVEALDMRADIIADLGLSRAALRVREQLRGALPGSAWALRQLASASREGGDHDAAVAAHERVVQLRYDDIGARRALIHDALSRGETARVLAQLDVLRAVLPGSPRNLRYAAGIYDALGRDDAMLAAYREAIAVCPEDVETIMAYGRALLQVGQPAAAVKTFRRALDIRPQLKVARELLQRFKPRPRRDERRAMKAEQFLGKRKKRSRYSASVLQALTVNTVYDNGLGSHFRQHVIQVHDEQGARRFRTYSIQYDPDSQHVDLRLARVFREDGSVLESVRTYEQSLGEPWYRIYYDTRALVVVFPDLEPGDTIEIRYRRDDIAHRNLFADYFGDMSLLQRSIPTARFEYVLVTPKSRKFYMRKPELAGLAHERTLRGDERIDRFVGRRIPPIVEESGMPGLTEVSPYLHVSTYKTWEQVGRWYWGLIKDQLYADAKLKATVAELVQGAKDTREKVERIHNWVLDNTRYVALEFGIHGYLPYRVPLVVQRGFGDCKDKASLMYTMFREAGIDARIVLVRTRRNGRIDEFPASLAVFDHAIAYVPELDLYLDGTAEHSGTRELPVQDQGVTVLVVGPDDVELRTTPVHDADRNRRTREMEVRLEPDGSAVLEVEERVKGADAAHYRSRYEAAGTRAERFEQSLSSSFAGVELRSQSFESLDDREQPVRFSYEARVPRMAHPDGDQLQMSPTSLDDLLTRMARTPARRHPLDLGGKRSYIERRTVHLPSGMRALTVPEGGEASSPFGRLQLRYEIEPGRVTTRTVFELRRDRVSPEQYPAFRRWVEQADGLLRERIILSRGGR